LKGFNWTYQNIKVLKNQYLCQTRKLKHSWTIWILAVRKLNASALSLKIKNNNSLFQYKSRWQSSLLCQWIVCSSLDGGVQLSVWEDKWKIFDYPSK